MVICDYIWATLFQMAVANLQRPTPPLHHPLRYRQVEIRSLAVAVITDRIAYNVWYSYRLLAGIAVVSMSIYLFTVSVKSAFDISQCFIRSTCFLSAFRQALTFTVCYG